MSRESPEPGIVQVNLALTKKWNNMDGQIFWQKDTQVLDYKDS